MVSTVRSYCGCCFVLLQYSIFDVECEMIVLFMWNFCVKTPTTPLLDISRYSRPNIAKASFEIFLVTSIKLAIFLRLLLQHYGD